VVRTSGQLFGEWVEAKSSLRECGVGVSSGVTAVLREEERGGLDFRAAQARAIPQCWAMPSGEPVSEELRPLGGCMAGRADPAARANARKFTVGRARFLRSGCGVIRKPRVPARPGAAHL